ncbi:MAG: pyridoxamine 5'-phosphate oxidase family protein [Pseudomonadaceae bacterium]|nr:pyridoxamine 5'-phosphate oxidase family protein [Pseudomonadaceae bacterium]
MNKIDSIAELESLYGEVSPRSLTKVRSQLSPAYERWINASRFLVLTTVGSGATDASPRGDAGAVVRVRDENTLLLPDWRGNNRLDSLRNIVEDGRVSLMFMVPGSTNVVRVNGSAVVTADDEVTKQFAQQGKHPRTVIVLTIAEVYFQCAKALMRSRLWQAGDESEQVPSAGDFLKEVQAEFDAEAYDSSYEEYAKDRMW